MVKSNQMVKKLSTEQKLEIAFSPAETLRELGKKYSVHHSSIAEILNESKTVLGNHWDTKSTRIGRPSNTAKGSDELESAAYVQEKKSYEEELALRQMRIDYLELQLKFKKDREAAENRKVKKQLKKKRKKPF